MSRNNRRVSTIDWLKSEFLVRHLVYVYARKYMVQEQNGCLVKYVELSDLQYLKWHTSTNYTQNKETC